MPPQRQKSRLAPMPIRSRRRYTHSPSTAYSDDANVPSLKPSMDWCPCSTGLVIT